MLLVHHRSYREDPELMITLCRRCHPKIHFLQWLTCYKHPYFVRLWREIHANRPFQLQFELVPEVVAIPALAA
jgi:hypothetical protein